MKFVVILLLGLSLVLAEKTRYDNWRLVKVTPSTEEHLQLLAKLEDETDFDIWNHISRINIGVDVALSPAAFEKYSKLFEQNGLSYKIINPNIQDNIDAEERQMLKNRLSNDNRVAGKYVSHTEINSWLEMVATANPTFLRTSNIGTTQGGKTLKTLIFKQGSPTRKIWIDCGIHAREWISPATCTYIINKLISRINENDPQIQQLLSKFEAHFLPVHNPDGYDYSRTNTRLWRKNRSTKGSTTCPGVDLNRNYGFQWMTGGASSSPCSDTYAGTVADSEPETQAVQAIINSALGQWDAFITIHSYGQWFLTPWGYTNALPTDYNAQLKLAQNTSDVIRSVYNMRYTSGSTSGLLYIASGNSADWAYGKAGIKYSYTIELRPGDNTADASYGFQLPEDRAPLVGEEIYQGLKYFVSQL